MFLVIQHSGWLQRKLVENCNNPFWLTCTSSSFISREYLTKSSMRIPPRPAWSSSCRLGSSSFRLTWSKLTKLRRCASRVHLGTDGVSKTDETSEKFQSAFDPPPHLWKIILRISRQNCDKSATKVRMFIWRNFCVFYYPISHEMHVAQMFNMVIG